jgi:hypothetical protein
MVVVIFCMVDLPMWASVAFAARCARRVQPFIKQYWPDIPRTYLDSIEECLLIGEGKVDVFDEMLPNRLVDAANATEALRRSAGGLAVHRCNAAISVGMLTAYAIKSAGAGHKHYVADNASDAAHHACMAFAAN